MNGNGNDNKSWMLLEFTPIHKYHTCVAVDLNAPNEDVHLNGTNADTFYHTIHKCNCVYLKKGSLGNKMLASEKV